MPHLQHLVNLASPPLDYLIQFGFIVVTIPKKTILQTRPTHLRL